MPTLRARRERGEAPEATMVTPRDVLLLGALAESGGLTGPPLAKLLDMSPEMVRRRCRLLKAASLVTTQTLSPSLPNVYLLGPKAPAHLGRVLGRPATDFEVPKPPVPWGPHRELVVSLFVAFRLALVRSREWRLDLFEFEAAIRRRVGDSAGVMIPDSILVVERDDGLKVAAALEADTGAENPAYVAQRKHLEFSRARERGGKLRGVAAWVVLWLSPDVHRRNRIAKAAWSAGCTPGLHYFLSLPELDPRSVLLDSWLTPRPVDGGARLIRESPFEAVAATVAMGVATGVSTAVPTGVACLATGRGAYDVDDDVVVGGAAHGRFTCRVRT